MIKIAPSILSADFANLERDIRRIDTADYVHVDVMDGLFVPNITIGIPVVKSIRPTTALPLDVHLMIDRPVRYVETFCQAGADIVTVHVEADTEENTGKALELIRSQGKRPGVVIKPGTPAEAVLPFLDQCAMVLVMTVEPGFGGQAFMPDMMEGPGHPGLDRQPGPGLRAGGGRRHRPRYRPRGGGRRGQRAGGRLRRVQGCRHPRAHPGAERSKLRG